MVLSHQLHGSDWKGPVKSPGSLSQTELPARFPKETKPVRSCCLHVSSCLAASTHSILAKPVAQFWAAWEGTGPTSPVQTLVSRGTKSVPAEAQHGIRNTLASDTRDSPTLHCLHRNPISKHHPQLEVTLAVCWLQTNAPEHLLRDPSPLPCALPRPIPSHCWQVYGRRKLSLLLSTPESLSRGCLQRWAVTHIVSEARLNQEKQVG